MKAFLKTAACAALAATYSTSSAAVSDEEFRALQQQLNLLADSIEQNASTSSDTSIGGYGELHYNNLSNGAGPQKKQIDFHRFVLFIGHEFSDKIKLFTEFELEHALAGEGKPGEVELEQAYVQIDIGDNRTINTGVFLVPVGIINETHEPGTFYGTERNPIEKNIIPATWWEAGVMLSGNTDKGISYDIALHSGLDGGTSIRGGRQKVANAKASNHALTGRIKYTGTAGLELAATLQIQDDITQDSSDAIGGATLIETHAIWNSGNTTVKALYARWDIDSIIKDLQHGGYIEASYKFRPSAGIFVRHNTWKTAGNLGSQIDFGLNYWVHEDVVFKLDYQLQDADAGDSDGFNAGFGYQF